MNYEKIRKYAERFRWEKIAKEIIEIYKGGGGNASLNSYPNI